ncbi:MAG: extracellular solute-binding protein, partial [Chloroflexi bacterium]|nr:extracellular solute-binding protein [Chloroflexota bacterium]
AGLLVYNKQAFDAVDEPYPQDGWTLDDLVAAGRRLSRDTDGSGRADRLGYAVRYNDLDAYPLLHLFGGRFFSQDGRTCQLGSAEALACVRWIYDQVHTNRIAPGPAQMVGGPLSMFHRGQVAMLRQTLREFASLRGADGAEDYEAVPFPRHPVTGKVAALSSSLSYGISRAATSAHGALQWIKFMSSREMGVQMFLGGYSYPGCRLASWQDARVVGEYPICAQLAEVADTAENEGLPWNLRLADCLAIWNDQMTRLWYGALTPEDCVARIVEGVDEVLQRPLETVGGEVLPDSLLPH